MSSTDIAAEVVELLMVKCGRRCCICRRFRPTHLQVHHIVERSRGGTDDEDNLIATCVTCHIDVHSTVPFTRRFTVDELKAHRDHLIHMLEQGILPREEEIDPTTIRVLIDVVGRGAIDTELSAEAAELLTKAALATGNRAGAIFQSDYVSGTQYHVGGESFPNDGSQRSRAKYRAAVQQLNELRLIEELSDAMHEVTDSGYVKADELLASAKQAES